MFLQNAVSYPERVLWIYLRTYSRIPVIWMLILLKQLRKMVQSAEVLASIPSSMNTPLPTSLAVKTPGPSGYPLQTEGIPGNRRGR
jgi:hypothetical protein